MYFILNEINFSKLFNKFKEHLIGNFHEVGDRIKKSISKVFGLHVVEPITNT